jgi:hypothetical protein
VGVLRVSDAATGTHVMSGLYQQIRTTPQSPDLDLLWTLLGVPKDPKTQPFDDHAPLAAIRTAITARPTSGAPPTEHAPRSLSAPSVRKN